MSETDPEVAAIPKLLATLEPLKAEQRIRVLTFVFQKLGIQMPRPENRSQDLSPVSDLSEALGTKSSQSTELDRPTGLRENITDIRSLKNAKNPRTASEMVALVAYYLEHLAPEGERREFITADDVRPYFKQAQYELPSAAPGMTLTHAKNAGYLNALARGQYRLNPVGYNLVAHRLPADEARSKRTKTTSPKKKIKRKRR
jgi:hypothetical protein